MTKNEIIRELSKCSASDVHYLHVVYHNECDNNGSAVEYTFSYNYNRPTSKAKVELLEVLMSIYKLRSYVCLIHTAFISDGELCKFNSDDTDSTRQATSLSDFISLTL